MVKAFLKSNQTDPSSKVCNASWPLGSPGSFHVAETLTSLLGAGTQASTCCHSSPGDTEVQLG